MEKHSTLTIAVLIDSTARESQSTKSLANFKPKEFLKRKYPDSDILRVAWLVYYLTYARNQLEFKSEDITKLNTEAAAQNFGNLLKTVNNAIARSHFPIPSEAFHNSERLHTLRTLRLVYDIRNKRNADYLATIL
jgi:hypothetical protein